MGCDTYWFGQKAIRFFDDDHPCVCTFPSNDAISKKLGAEKVRSLAALGAAIAMIAHKELGVGTDYIYIPSDLPEWIWEQIKKNIPIQE